MRLLGIDHVQLAMPQGGEPLARKFYCDLLGLTEMEKPAALMARGGCWFEMGTVKVHLGVEADFRPARKAHPAFAVEGMAALIARLTEAGVDIARDVPLDGIERVHVNDPFGNRIELLERIA